jgi:hypothetical protein
MVDAADGEKPGRVHLIKAIGRGDVRHYGVVRIPSRGSAYIEPVERKADVLQLDKHDLGDSQGWRSGGSGSLARSRSRSLAQRQG